MKIYNGSRSAKLTEETLSSLKKRVLSDQPLSVSDMQFLAASCGLKSEAVTEQNVRGMQQAYRGLLNSERSQYQAVLSADRGGVAAGLGQARRRFEARIKELTDGGLKYPQAWSTAKAEDPDRFELADFDFRRAAAHGEQQNIEAPDEIKKLAEAYLQKCVEEDPQGTLALTV